MFVTNGSIILLSSLVISDFGYLLSSSLLQEACECFLIFDLPTLLPDSYPSVPACYFLSLPQIRPLKKKWVTTSPRKCTRPKNDISLRNTLYDCSTERHHSQWRRSDCSGSIYQLVSNGFCAALWGLGPTMKQGNVGAAYRWQEGAVLV
jgi:hypothetical protein